jgi:hypothetical protein
MTDIDTLEKLAMLMSPDAAKKQVTDLFKSLRMDPASTYMGGINYMQGLRKKDTEDQFAGFLNGFNFGLVCTHMLSREEFLDTLNKVYGRSQGENVVDFITFRGKK